MTITADLPHRELADIAVDLRRVITPVLGYLELLSGEGAEAPSEEEQRRWIHTLEERLVSLEDLGAELMSACSELRELSASPAASRPPGRARPD